MGHLKKAVLIGVTILFLNLVISNAIAEVDLDTIDLQILDVQIEQFESGYQKKSELIKLKLNFTNNGESYYSLKGVKNQAILILAPINTSPDEITSGSPNIMKDFYEYVYYDNLKIQYEDIPALGQECEPIEISLRAEESRKITICYEIPITSSRSTTKRIDDNQYFFRLGTVPFGSSCPNCKAISLKDVVETKIEEKPTIVEEAEEKRTPEKDSYNILVHELPRIFEKEFPNILENSLIFWGDNFSEIEFNQVKYWKDADFSIEWASILQEGQIGYYTSCCDDFGLPKVVIALGYYDENDKWTLVDRDYAQEILKHEIGHAMGLGHVDDLDDIMFPIFHEYEKWKELDEIKKGFVTDKSKTEIPDFIRNTAKWWSEGKIEDNDFVFGVQYLIKENIMQIPDAINKETENKSQTKDGSLMTHAKEYYLLSNELVYVYVDGEYYDQENIRVPILLTLIYPDGNSEEHHVYDIFEGEFLYDIPLSSNSLLGIYTLKAKNPGNDFGTVKFEVKSEKDKPEEIELEIPSWIKNNADWWSQGLISDDDFVKGIQYLVENGIIKV